MVVEAGDLGNVLEDVDAESLFKVTVKSGFIAPLYSLDATVSHLESVVAILGRGFHDKGMLDAGHDPQRDVGRPAVGEGVLVRNVEPAGRRPLPHLVMQINSEYDEYMTFCCNLVHLLQ